MGLRKVRSDGDAYMFTNSSSKQNTLTITIVEKDNSFNVKVCEGTDGVVRWSRNLKKTPGEYMTLLTRATEGSAAPDDSSSGKGVGPQQQKQQQEEEDVFEVQDDYLIWKQFFPDQKVYGKLGKFKMEKIDYEEAVSECLAGAVNDLTSKTNTICTLERESEEMEKQLGEAIELAAKSVRAKEDFEKEVYGKCAAIINAKKHRIIQLRSAAGRPTAAQFIGESSHSSSSGGSGGQAEDRVSSSRPQKKARVDLSSSDGYSSDTDVDDIDAVDTSGYDDRASPAHSRSPVKPKPSAVPVKAIDSQELFNDSLELELYPTGSTNKIQVKNDPKASAETSKPSVGSSGKDSTSNKKKTSVTQEESEVSIFSQIF